jgi:hypothetical protein
MYIQNITNNTMQINKSGQVIIVNPNSVQYIPEYIVTEEELKVMIPVSDYIVLESSTAPKNFLSRNQQVLKLGTLYLVQESCPKNPRLYIGNGELVDIYGSDSQTEPASLASMSNPTSFHNITGIQTFASGAVPKFIAVSSTATNVEIIATNMTCYEVGTIA